MTNKLPFILVRVNVKQTAFDPDAIDAEVYCINISKESVTLRCRNESFLTLDDEGEAMSESQDRTEFTLASGAVRRVAAIAGWEWDGHVGMEITYSVNGKPEMRKAVFNFKSGKADYFIESLSLQGRIIPEGF